jgi:hypothetical protein
VGTIVNDDTIAPPPPASLTLVPDPVFPGQTAMFIGGTANNDTIELTNDPAGAVKVKFNGKAQGSFAFDGAIYIYAGAGGDRVTIDSHINKVSFVFGEDGNDVLKGGGGSSVLIGGQGVDQLTGNVSRDILIGGGGVDKLSGGDDDDILVGGGTVFDADPISLGALLQEWTRTDEPYMVRVKDIRNGGGLNGTVKLSNGNLIADGQVDTENGQAGTDLFFGNTLGPTKFWDHTDRLLVETIFQLA